MTSAHLEVNTVTTCRAGFYLRHQLVQLRGAWRGSGRLRQPVPQQIDTRCLAAHQQRLQRFDVGRQASELCVLLGIAL